MFLVGSDFAYISKAIRPGQQESSLFKYIDTLIEILNSKSEETLGFKVKARYATPSDYFQSLEKEIS